MKNTHFCIIHFVHSQKTQNEVSVKQRSLSDRHKSLLKITINSAFVDNSVRWFTLKHLMFHADFQHVELHSIFILARCYSRFRRATEKIRTRSHVERFGRRRRERNDSRRRRELQRAAARRRQPIQFRLSVPLLFRSIQCTGLFRFDSHL